MADYPPYRRGKKWSASDSRAVRPYNLLYPATNHTLYPEDP